MVNQPRGQMLLLHGLEGRMRRWRNFTWTTRQRPTWQAGRFVSAGGTNGRGP